MISLLFIKWALNINKQLHDDGSYDMIQKNKKNNIPHCCTAVVISKQLDSDHHIYPQSIVVQFLTYYSHV